MENRLNVQALGLLGTRFVVLGAGGYALPVRFRIREPAVECLVPTWSGLGDLAAAAGDVTLVAALESGAHLRWLFLRGPAAVVPDPDWEGFQPLAAGRISPDDLYQLLRILPRRIERIDEQRGWGCRETGDC
jgi:hypothetical protein